MPPPARISVPVKQPSQVNNDVESSLNLSNSMVRTKKPRVVPRRRARGRLNETDSDEEVVREPRSDSDTDTVTSSIESESLSDTETEDESKSRSCAPSPADLSLVAQASSFPIVLPDVPDSLFPKPQDWSEMVTDEKENGQADLPVIDFANFSVSGNSISQQEDRSYSLPRSSQAQRKRSHSRDVAPEDASSSKRNQGSARHAYLQKLTNDPAYVPTVGQFWSHDDRLLDKDLRSLSGWWRGKWQGSGGGGSRGRGRGGFVWGGRGRGRGGFNNVNSQSVDIDDGPWQHDRYGAKEDERRGGSSRGAGGAQDGDVWKHDLFDTTEPDLPRKGRAPKSDWKHGSLDAVEDEWPSAPTEKPESPEPGMSWGAASQAEWAAPTDDGESFKPLWGSDSAVTPKDEHSDLALNNDLSEIEAGGATLTDGEWSATTNDGATIDNDGAFTPTNDRAFTSTNEETFISINEEAFTSNIDAGVTSTNDPGAMSTNDGWSASTNDGEVVSRNDDWGQSTSKPQQTNKKPKNKPRGAESEILPAPRTNTASTDPGGWAATSTDANNWAAPSTDANAWAAPSTDANNWAAPSTDAVGWAAPKQEHEDDVGGWAAPQGDADESNNEWTAPNGWGAIPDRSGLELNQGKRRRKTPRDNDDWIPEGSTTRDRSGNARGRGRGRGQLNSGNGFSSPRDATSPRPPRVQQPKTRPARMRAAVEPSEPDILAFGNNVRPWFSMKPERVWTKQFDGYLYFEAHLKPVPTQNLGQGVRIKLPRAVSSVDGEDIIIRLPLGEASTSEPQEPVVDEPLHPNSFVVKLPSPKSLGKRREVPAIDEVATLSVAPLSAPQPTHSAVLPEAQEYSNWEEGTSSYVKVPLTNQHSEDWSSSVNAVEEPHTFDGQRIEADQVNFTHTQPLLPPLQTLPPPFPPAASYGSPYSYPTQGLPLPPGIAFADNGMTYEIATGRAVYLQTPPLPPPQSMQIPMYNSQTMPMHHGHHGSVHFIPHHSPMSMSVSPPAFLQNPPLFSLPRQGSRIEIRAPSGDDQELEAKHTRMSSQGQLPGSRLAADAEPFTPAAHAQAHAQAMEYYAAEAQQSFDDVQRQQQAMYQQPTYYYPMTADGNNPYGYAHHYPGVDVGQSQQYSSYGQEPYPGGYY